MILRSAKKPTKILAAGMSIFMFLIIWQIGTMGSLGRIIPGPIHILSSFLVSFIKPIGTRTMILHALTTLSRFGIGFGIAIVLGVIFGLLMGWYKRFEAFSRPLFELIRPIPTLAWIPLIILWFGIGETTKYVLVFIGAFLSITQNAYMGAKSVDPTIVRAARMLGTSDRQLFWTIVIPSSVPAIFAGLHIGLASAWASVVAAEMVRSSSGVGWMIVTGQENGDMTQILVGIMAIAVIGFTLAVIMRGVEDKLCRWNERGR